VCWEGKKRGRGGNQGRIKRIEGKKIERGKANRDAAFCQSFIQAKGRGYWTKKAPEERRKERERDEIKGSRSSKGRT